jgi:hypothetical protein
LWELTKRKRINKEMNVPPAQATAAPISLSRRKTHRLEASYAAKKKLAAFFGKEAVIPTRPFRDMPPSPSNPPTGSAFLPIQQR